jgi:hypothetical protein
LFVVGEQPMEDIVSLAKEHNIKHIYMTGNVSYDRQIDYNTPITALIGMGFVVTLDYPVEEHPHVLGHLSSLIWQSPLFIPMISCKIAKLDKCGNNLTVKIDDEDFKGPEWRSLVLG